MKSCLIAFVYNTIVFIDETLFRVLPGIVFFSLRRSQKNAAEKFDLSSNDNSKFFPSNSLWQFLDWTKFFEIVQFSPRPTLQWSTHFIRSF